MSDSNPTVVDNPWQALRQFTAARIALGRSGVSLPTSAQLEFQLAHARARDAVHLALDTQALRQALNNNGDICITLSSAAETRDIYLQRPDLGRRLDTVSRSALTEQPRSASRRYDLAIVIADGLSALAIEQNALPFLDALKQRLAPENWTLAPLAIVRQGRVAIGDEVGELLGAKAVVVLIGERPGLSSPDSMGLYLTWAPRVGLTDESRNCISNVRPAGLSYAEAAYKLHYLLTQARQRQLSGVQLKDETASEHGELQQPERNFLLEER
ncbi:ethanolamine ammonia-lyase subunit EutC [Collimonas fungivorans]|uniref:Ethanolamine ammonia-lyase small subunit n=1 Tax=Collimonas fungivorans (strain Ter331) TaxID=1005048 RepID=G0A8L1_COLFT|nr:ethanolamine ammonia-lyase subunit EutC [Collimonas fungivorans]AEK61484.1 Ethanolamine ammonia-lyase light chain [Collimonas fungivorans Ter331]